MASEGIPEKPVPDHLRVDPRWIWVVNTSILVSMGAIAAVYWQEHLPRLLLVTLLAPHAIAALLLTRKSLIDHGLVLCGGIGLAWKTIGSYELGWLGESTQNSFDVLQVGLILSAAVMFLVISRRTFLDMLKALVGSAASYVAVMAFYFVVSFWLSEH
jgi:hypothetical protein